MAYTSINSPTDYFNAKLYTGNGSTQSITGVGFQPDWVWIKDRNNITNHMVFDSVRSTGKELHTQNADSETTQANTLTTFGSDGFSLGSNSDVNNSSQNFVSWNWLAGGTASSNSNGSITSSVSTNTTSGFSIVSYTGAGGNQTVGHGLGVVPSVIIVKARSTGGDWTSYHSTLGNTKFLRLNSTIAAATQSTYWQDTDPTSSVFSVGNAGDVNTSSGTHIAYCFAEKKGFSKFGSYTGNGNADGTFVYTGFSPSFVIVKKTNATGNWVMFDNKRNTFNVVDKRLASNLGDDEGISDRLDFLSNGWKFRSTATNVNGSDSFIYMAFAESPFTTSTGVPTTAR